MDLAASRMIATAVSVAIAAALRVAWERKKARDLATDAENGDVLLSRRNRRSENIFLIGLVVVGVVSAFVTHEMLKGPSEALRAERSARQAAETKRLKALYGQDAVIVKTPPAN